jgi:hypothetical protein
MPRQPAIWVACVAIGLSLASGARAIVNQVTGNQIQRQSLSSADIRPGSVTSSDLAAGAVNNTTIAEAQVGTNDIADGAVTTDKLADRSVTADKLSGVSATSIADGAVGADALAPNSVNGSIVAHSIGARELAPEAPITYVGQPGGPPWLLATGDPGVIGFLAGDADQAGAGFYKDNSGDVHLVGAFESVITGTTAFVLPPGFRPPVDMYFAARAAGAADVLFIDTAGDVLTLTQAQADPLTAVLQVLPLPDLFILQGISWRPTQAAIG